MTIMSGIVPSDVISRKIRAGLFRVAQGRKYAVLQDLSLFLVCSSEKFCRNEGANSLPFNVWRDYQFHAALIRGASWPMPKKTQAHGSLSE